MSSPIAWQLQEYPKRLLPLSQARRSALPPLGPEKPLAAPAHTPPAEDTVGKEGMSDALSQAQRRARKRTERS